MTDSTEITRWEEAIGKAQETFALSTLKYDNEKVFALQHLQKSDYTMKVAKNNPLSVNLAMRNVAATGLTLNPAYAYAYLIPRTINDVPQIVLDISARGLVKIATDTGSVLWAKPEVVYANDQFDYRGPVEAPVHRANPFSDRGEIVGAYCVAKTLDGAMLVTVLDRAELEKIRGKSEAYKKNKSGPWVEWFSEMCCKAVLKRAQKTWPHSDRTDKLLDAIEIANEAEGGYALEGMAVTLINEDQAAKVREWMETAGVDESFLRLFDVEAVEAIPKLRYNEVISTLKARAA